MCYNEQAAFQVHVLFLIEPGGGALWRQVVASALL
jgi:hypothetical protein